MSRRPLVLVAALAALLAVAPHFPAPVGAQSPAPADRSSHGADLSGVWTSDPSRLPERVRAVYIWAFDSEPPPMTPWALERFAGAKPTFGPKNYAVAETNDPVYKCFPPGTPRIYFHPFPMEIIQTSGRVLMFFEYDHLVRQIYTDGRPHRDDLPASWLGDSTGRWEGDTLVVETVNFNDQTWIDRRGVPHSDQLKVTERIRRIDDKSLQIDITIEDPSRVHTALDRTAVLHADRLADRRNELHGQRQLPGVRTGRPAAREQARSAGPSCRRAVLRRTGGPLFAARRLTVAKPV